MKKASNYKDGKIWVFSIKEGEGVRKSFILVLFDLFDNNDVIYYLFMCSWELVCQVWGNLPLHVFQLTLELLVQVEQPCTQGAWLARVLQVQGCGHYTQGLEILLWSLAMTRNISMVINKD